MILDDAELESQLTWTPRAMSVDGERFVVELAPFCVNAFAEKLRDDNFCSHYEGHEITGERGLPVNDHDFWYVEEDAFNLLKAVTKLYFIGEDKTLCLEFKNWPTETGFPFPKSVALPQLVDDGGNPIQHPRIGKLEWENGVKQSMHDGCCFDTKAEYFDFVQRVKAERRNRGLDTGVEADGDPDVGDATWRIGRLEVIRKNESVKYDGKSYLFTESKAWENLYKLIEGRGEYVLCDAGLKKYFTSKEAKAFYAKAIKAKGAGRKGDGTYKLNI